MSFFESQVETVRSLLMAVPSVPLDWESQEGFPKGRRAGLILRNEAAAELGGPNADSALVAFYSNAEGGDSVRLIGHDIKNLGDRDPPFAEVIILKGSQVTTEIYYQFLQRHQRLFDQPGWMVKAARGAIWVRASVQDGAEPSFERAAATLVRRIHADFPQVAGVEIWFICGMRSLTRQLSALAGESASSVKDLKENVWKERGFDYRSCQLTGHCGNCADKKTCNSVRRMEAAVRVNRRRHAEECQCAGS